MRERKKANHARDDGNTLNQAVRTKCEPGYASIGINANGGDKQPYRARNNTLAHVSGAHNGNGAQTKKTQPEIFRPAELQGKSSQSASKEQKEEYTYNAAKSRGKQRGIQGFVRFAVLRKRPAVKSCGNRRRRTWCADEHRRVGTAVNGAYINGAEHDKTRGRIHGKGRGDHQGNTHGSRKTRQGANDYAACEADNHKEDIQGINEVQKRWNDKLGHMWLLGTGWPVCCPSCPKNLFE